jgi:intracellular septation protein A
MLVLRLLFILSAIAMVVFGGLYLFTHNRRYLNLVWQIARFVFYAVLIFVLLYVLERYVLTGWRVLL